MVLPYCKIGFLDIISVKVFHKYENDLAKYSAQVVRNVVIDMTVDVGQTQRKCLFLWLSLLC